MRVVLADGSVLLREGMRRLLDEAEIEVVAQAADGSDLLRKVRAHKPDVVVVDLRMPNNNDDDGLAAALTIRSELPEIGVLVLSQKIEDSSASELLADNASGFGYLLKDRIVDVNQFIDAMRRVAGGGSALDPEIVSRLVGRIQSDNPFDGLTRREREVLRLMVEGRTNHAIAETLVITRRAAEKHVTSIFTKLNLESTPDDHRRVLAVVKYLQRQ